MSIWLIALTGFIYLGVAVEQAFRHNWPMTIVYLGYALANVGLCLLPGVA